MNILTKFAAASAVALSLGQGIGFSGAAHATPVTCTAASQGSLELYLADKGCKFPDESEKKVYLDSADGVNVGSGNVGKQTGLPEVSFTSSSKIKLANGFANIKGTDDKVSKI
jgi:hypothetical protein